MIALDTVSRFDIKLIYASVLRCKKVFATIIVVTMILSILYITHMTKLYTATALIDVSPTPLLSLTNAKEREENPSDPVLIRSEVDVLSSDEMARRVIRQLSLQTNTVFMRDEESAVGYVVAKVQRILSLFKDSPPPLSADATLEYIVRKYYADVSIVSDPKSTIARVNAISSDPYLASNIANTHARIYLRNRLDRKLENTDVSEIKMISSAGIPFMPVFPKTKLLIIASFFMSILFATFVVIIVDQNSIGYGDLTRISSVLQLEPISSVPMLGLKQNGVGWEQLISDRIRDVRLAIGNEMHNKVIMFSSFGQDEGSSEICVAVASSLARLEKKVLLIDGSVRRPKTAELTGIDTRSSGLESLLVGDTKLADAIQSGSFDVLPTFRCPAPPIDELTGDTMKQLISDVKSMYDIIIIDTTPSVLASDCFAVAKMCDAVVYVIRNINEKKSLLQLNINRLKRSSSKIIGIVFTGIDPRDEYLVQRNQR